MKKRMMLKEQYKKSVQPYTSAFAGLDYDYPCRRNFIFRKFSTRQEKSSALMHKIEYAEYGLKIRVCRAAALVDDYEDLVSGLYGVKNCWKHNSKRKHQWIEVF